MSEPDRWPWPSATICLAIRWWHGDGGGKCLLFRLNRGSILPAGRQKEGASSVNLGVASETTAGVELILAGTQRCEVLVFNRNSLKTGIK